MSSTDFYRAFEERYRGSRELIRQRLQAYAPFIGPLRSLYQPAPAIDLGCGRGEWLELLQDAGFQPHGVDLDAGMLAACTERGLPVTQGDAIAYLQALGDASQCIVSGFHLAEHMAFSDLETLVCHALRVLKPGGLLILETPNPENVVVGTSSFYLDPTHLRPLPPLLLSFLPEHHGFARVCTVRLQEPAELHQRSDIRLIDVLGGVSLDYAIVAQKAAPPEILSCFDAAFTARYGIELQELAGRYDGTLDRRMSAIDQRLVNAEAQAAGMTDALGRIGTLQDRLLETTTQWVRTQAKLEHLQAEAAQAMQRKQTELEHLQRAAAWATQRLEATEAHARALEAEHHALRRSASWRLTAPLRFTAQAATRPVHTARSGANAAIRHTIDAFQPPLAWLMGAVLRRPELRARLSQWLLRYPALHQQLVDVAIRRSVLQQVQEQMSSAAGHGTSQRNPALAPFALHPRVLPAFPTLPEALLLSETLPELDAKLRWVRLVGHIEGHYSLAIVNRGLATALSQVNGQRLSFVPHHGQPYAKAPELAPEQDPGLLLHDALRREVPADAVQNAISLVHHYPFIADALPSGLRGMLFFWEETSVPAATVEHINTHFDTVWVAAMSVKHALINSGCAVPVFVIPIGIDHLISAAEAPLGPLQVADGQRFRFLHVSSAFERKGVDVLLAAYLDAFTADDPVELYIKTFPNPHNHIHAQLKALRADRERPAHVTIDEHPLDDAAMLALYRSAHAMVLPTRGEGFNLPAAEALAMALPVITTGYSAQVDFCSHATATLVNFQFAASRSHLRASDACWAEPDPVDLAAKLRQVRERILVHDPALEAQRQAAMHYVRDTYRWEHSARAVLQSAAWLESHQPAAAAAVATPLKMALISPWATRCGVAEYSHNLLRPSLQAQQLDLSVYCDDRTTAPPAECQASWTLGNNDTVPRLLERLRHSSDAQVVFVQHQPSLFPLSDDCCAQLAALSAQGKVVVLELHSTQPLLEDHPISPAGVRALAHIDRIIVHKPQDLNYLLALGLAGNAMLLHHGVIQPMADPQPAATRAQLGIAGDALVLGCFGFALPHKGIDTLIETIVPLAQASGREVHLLAINSVLDERSARFIEDCQKRVRQLGVESCVHWTTDYQPIDACQKLLCAADFVVFPYKYTRESASGAVTVGLSTLKPVLVSPLDIFSDLADVTWKMDGHGADDIVQAVQHLLAKTDAALSQRQQEWLHTRDWSVLSARLLRLMHALGRERHWRDAIAPARHAEQAGWLAQRRKQLLVDVSELYYRDARTGIQRVVRNILGELLRAPPAGYDICPVYGSKTDGFRTTGKFHLHGGAPAPCANDEQPVTVGPGDIFLGLDLAAHLFPEAEQHLQAFRLAGAKVYYVVYDIIPLRHAQYTVPGMAAAFDVWLRALGRCADGLLCISDAVAQDVAAWLREQAPGAPLPCITHFHLGADMEPAPQSAPTSQALPPDATDVLARIQARTSFLMVGTIEPRKGHAQTLAAFELLWAQGVQANLVIVGKTGWNTEALTRQLRKHPENGQRLFWLEGINDAYLEAVYAASTCLIAASYCEGFGLPLIEAAQHRLPILARDIPVFREVAGEHAAYFDGPTPHDLTSALDRWLALYASGQHPRPDAMPWQTWAQSAQQLLQHLLPPERTELPVQ